MRAPAKLLPKGEALRETKNAMDSEFWTDNITNGSKVFFFLTLFDHTRKEVKRTHINSKQMNVDRKLSKSMKYVNKCKKKKEKEKINEQTKNQKANKRQQNKTHTHKNPNPKAHF